MTEPKTSAPGGDDARRAATLNERRRSLPMDVAGATNRAGVVTRATYSEVIDAAEACAWLSGMLDHDGLADALVATIRSRRSRQGTCR